MKSLSIIVLALFTCLQVGVSQSNCSATASKQECTAKKAVCDFSKCSPSEIEKCREICATQPEKCCAKKASSVAVLPKSKTAKAKSVAVAENQRKKVNKAPVHTAGSTQ